MRNPDRLDSFYEKLKEIHKTYFPDLRFGQLMMNFLGWVSYDKRCDPFFPEEPRMLEYLEEYVSSKTPYNYGDGFLDDRK